MDNDLGFTRQTSWNGMDSTVKTEVFDFAKGYYEFLNASKTEREASAKLLSLAKENGFIDFNDVINGETKLKEGLRVYYVNRGKSLILAVIGKAAPESGLRIIGSHIDAPRLDLKPTPLYEDGETALLKTHYYGGIKKYQWVTTPLSMHGVIIKKDGSAIDVCIGENDDDPIFVISDILPHLGSEQMALNGSTIIKAEQLNVLIGSIPFECDDKDKATIKNNVLNILNQMYGICEKDFNHAEIEIVPAFKARDIGVDRGLIGSYGQDDRVCAYTSLEALLQIKDAPQKTCVCYFSDKEEIGSMGNTGAQSAFFDTFVFELVNLYKPNSLEISVKRTLMNSKLLSADVTAGFDSCFPECFDKLNCSYCGRGIAIEKYTGSRGKSGASDANAEFLSEIINIFEDDNVAWQLTEMGRVDLGGGGTIAQYMANRNINVIDCGVPVMSMHAPFEITSKADVYYAYRAYRAFFFA